jgi:hypothetical protein
MAAGVGGGGGAAAAIFLFSLEKWVSSTNF